MRRTMIRTMTLAAAVTAGQPAAAWLIYPDRDRPRLTIVEIEKPYGDLVPFASLPRPYNTAAQMAQGPQSFVYHWRYAREAVGFAFLSVDEDGRGEMQFRFEARRPVEGARYGAAAVFVSEDGRPLHTFYARADAAPDLAGENGHRVDLVIERPPEWWRDVSAIRFFYMTYNPIQKLDDEGVWQAMRRAVGHFTRGQGTEQRG